MEIQYIRKLTASHMVVEQSAELTEWEEQMIAHVTVDEILFAECVRENNQNNLWYDITGKQSLDTVLESTELHYELLCRLLTGIYGAVEHLESILLQADALLLLPECIFLDYRTEQIYFCYYPGSIKGMPEAFAELMEYLLTRIDHGDERVVTLAYDVYERTSRGEGSLRELKELLRLPYEKDETEDIVESDTEEDLCGSNREDDIRVSVDEDRIPNKTDEKDILSRNDEKDILRRNDEEWYESEKNERSCRNKRGFFDKRDFLHKKEFSGSKKSEAGWKLSVEKCVNWIKQLPWIEDLRQRRGTAGGTGALITKAKSVRRQERAEEKFVFEPEEEEEPRATRPTVLLSQITRPPEGVLRYEGKGACKDLHITGSSYVIGSERGCEGYIPSTTVSRRHARISRTEDIYFIEDLNSSNGTYVGGEMLNYKTKVSLQKNEIVIFADEKFRFI